MKGKLKRFLPFLTQCQILNKCESEYASMLVHVKQYHIVFSPSKLFINLSWKFHQIKSKLFTLQKQLTPSLLTFLFTSYFSPLGDLCRDFSFTWLHSFNYKYYVKWQLPDLTRLLLGALQTNLMLHSSWGEL